MLGQTRELVHRAAGHTGLQEGERQPVAGLQLEWRAGHRVDIHRLGALAQLEADIAQAKQSLRSAHQSHKQSAIVSLAPVERSAHIVEFIPPSGQPVGVAHRPQRRAVAPHCVCHRLRVALLRDVLCVAMNGQFAPTEVALTLQQTVTCWWPGIELNQRALDQGT